MNWPAIALLLIGLSGAGGFWFGSDYKEKSIKAEIMAEKEGMARAAEAMAIEISKVKVVQKNQTNILEKEVRVEKVYEECKHSPTAFKVLNDALTQGAKK